MSMLTQEQRIRFLRKLQAEAHAKEHRALDSVPGNEIVGAKDPKIHGVRSGNYEKVAQEGKRYIRRKRGVGRVYKVMTRSDAPGYLRHTGM
jgi:hypothetical protein